MIELKDVAVEYQGQDRKALESISFSVGEGEKIALLGANGAGKSTLLKAIIGILPHCEGDISVNGIGLSRATELDIRRQVGLVFQNPEDQLFMARVWEDVAFGPSNLGYTDEALEKRVTDSLSGLSVLHLKNRSTIQLSYGEKRMVAMAAVLAMEPKVLLFDEPSSFLDPKARNVLIKHLQKLSHSQLIATHDFDLAQSLCTRAILLKKGKIYAQGDPKILLADTTLLEDCDLL